MPTSPLPYSKVGSGFTFPEYSPQYPRDPEYKLNHYKLEIKVYIAEKRLEGKATLTLTRYRKPKRYITLDAVEMDIKSVFVDGVKVKYDYDGEKLYVDLGKLLDDKPIELVVEYKVVEPRFGLYFITPDEHYPNRRYEVWSQGETEWNRYWMPIYDYPNNKCTSEIIVWVPKGYIAVSNGSLIEKKIDGDWEVYHWLFDKPHSTYLIALAVGRYIELKEEMDGVTLYYYVPPDKVNDADRSFSRTKDMIKFYESYLGVKYPYGNYKQVCVQNFVVGGMENTSITILLEETLHDEHAHMDFESEPLVAHELAHQWFGDLVTCKDWSHIWLNESFATYLENLYVRHWKGEDDFIYEMMQDLDNYLMECRRNYSRPIVYNIYKYSEEVFDQHSYPKGGLILHTLSNILGEDTFRKGLKEFLTRFAYKNADTEDLRKVLSEVSGLNLEWFFNQFVYNAGHPVIKISKSWDSEKKVLKVMLSQEQDDKAPEKYYLPMELLLIVDNREIIREIVLEERKQTIYIPLDKKPDMVLLDPKFKVFKVLEVDYPLEDKIRILKESKYVYWRLLMARALGKEKSAKAVDALKEAVLKDSFWGVSSEAAASLGKIGTDRALKVLLECIDKVTHPKVKRAIVKALGGFKSEEAAKKLLEVLSNSKESYYVRGEAATSLGKTKVKWALEEIEKFLDTPSHMEIITRGVLMGLAEYGGEQAKKIILKYTEKDKNRWVRMTATQLLGKFPNDKEVYEKLRELAKENDHRIQIAVANAARELMDPKLIDTLQYIIDNPAMPWAYKVARIVQSKIKEHMEKGVEYKALREEIEKVKEENKKLLERIERMEIKV